MSGFKYMHKILRYLIASYLSISAMTIFTIEVGGHLTEDVTWSPENNPYEVIDVLYVDSGVTLTILPGTEVKISSASCTNSAEQLQNFWYQNGTPVAKMFWVDGRIIAEGTHQDSILFTRLEDDPNFYWGTIYITQQAEACRFQHCKFEYSAGMGIAVGNIAEAALSIYNGYGIVKNCTFMNNGSHIVTSYSQTKEIEIVSNEFLHDDDIIDYVLNLWIVGIGFRKHAEGFKPALLAGNYIYDCYLSIRSLYMTDNELQSSSIATGNSEQFSYFYDNVFNSGGGIHGGDTGDSIYIKDNQFNGSGAGVDIDYGYVEISDNGFDGGEITLYFTYSSKIFNNFFENNLIGYTVNGNIGVISNNVFFDGDDGLSGRGEEQFSNNIFINNNYIFSSVTDTHIIENQIFLFNEELFDNNLYGNPIFRNCILDFELPPECIDGGGNIWVDSLQAESIFEDIQNGDFHLTPGSIAIDAGFDTLGYYYPFDIEYNQRIWDGDSNGSAIIDIGPYEFGAPSLGGIEGITYDANTNDPVDFVLIKINNEPGEFTFSDSDGNYEIKLPAGIYDVYAERLFYDDGVEYQIEVIEGEFTFLSIPMNTSVGINDPLIPDSNFPISNLSNYPNPFNPTTTISFNLSSESVVSVNVYNLKGQKVKQLISDRLDAGEHTLQWNGRNDSNKSVSSGIYFYKITTDKDSEIKKMLLLK